MTAHPTTDDPAPYVGARPFRTGEQDIFFGRERETASVADAWRRHRVTVLHGSAGVGKTSLLRAGVLPRLRAQGIHPLPVGHIAHRPAFPLAALPEQNPYIFALLSSWYPGESPIRVASRTVLDVIRKRTGTDRFGRPFQTLVAIDQAELAFRESVRHRRHRERLFDELAKAMAACPELHLLLTVRDDHVDEAWEAVARLPEDIADHRLDPFDRDAALAAVRGPWEQSGGPFPVETAALLVDELCTVRSASAERVRTTSIIEPAVLQIVCARLWADRRTDPDISGEQLADDIDRALAEHCAQALATVAADHRLPSQELLGWFRTASASPPHRSVAPEGHGDTRGMPDAVLRAMTDRHLLRPRLEAGVRRYELRHPRLVAAVHRLGDRLGPPRRPDPPARLREAELALAEGDFRLARQHMEGAVRACGTGDLRLLAEAECFLGDIAHEQGKAETAAQHYRTAAGLYEALQDTSAVGRLLAALGRLKLDASATEAVQELRAAADRLPNDLAVQTGLGQALWQAGQTRAALAVLNWVLTRDGGTPEALRSRGEILADLGEAESALRDLDRIDHNARPSTQAAWVLAQAMRHVKADQRALEHTIAGDTDNGPVLLRVARVRQLGGNVQAAAGLAARAVEAKRPPLPPQLRDEAHRLMGALSAPAHVSTPDPPHRRS